MALSNKDKVTLAGKIECEGFDYCFLEWSWKEIKDKEFHKRLAAYRKAHRALENYLDLDGIDWEAEDEAEDE